MPQPLQFEYVDDLNVCEFTTGYTVLSAVYRYFKETTIEKGLSYIDFCYETISFLRFLPSSIRNRPIEDRCREEALRCKVAALLLSRQDLVEHFFMKKELSEDDLVELIACYEKAKKVTIIVDTPERFENLPVSIKGKLTQLINQTATKLGTGLLEPSITHDELELLLTTGKCENIYRCRNVSAFSFILKTLADEHVLDISCYQNIVCQGQKLYSFGIRKSPEPLAPKSLSKSYNLVNEKSQKYVELGKSIIAILRG